MAFGIGRPWPLGSSKTEAGVNFVVAAPQATKVELLLFENGNSPEPFNVLTLDANHRSGDYWHVEVEGLGFGCCYGYRVFGPKLSTGHDLHGG